MTDKEPAPEEMSEKEIDDTLRESFPASDPPQWTLGTDHPSETVDPTEESESSTSPQDGSPSRSSSAQVPRERLPELRQALLHLHKSLLDMERANYEQRHGSVSSGDLLNLVVGDEQFAWLRLLSALIVRIDEALDEDEATTSDDVTVLFKETRTLLKASETGSPFEQKYHAALQREPEVVLAHGDVMAVLK